MPVHPGRRSTALFSCRMSHTGFHTPGAIFWVLRDSDGMRRPPAPDSRMSMSKTASRSLRPRAGQFIAFSKPFHVSEIQAYALPVMG
jgi:hypothetical protein